MICEGEIFLLKFTPSILTFADFAQVSLFKHRARGSFFGFLKTTRLHLLAFSWKPFLDNQEATDVSEYRNRCGIQLFLSEVYIVLSSA